MSIPSPRIFFILALFCAGIFLQYSLFVNYDIVHLLYATDRMLDGGRYAKDFFTPNLPMILYLYALPTWAAKFMRIDLYTIFPLYSCLLSLISVCLAIFTLDRLDIDKQVKTLFVFWFALSCFILPCFQLGQRDLLFFQFIIPWVLLLLGRLQHQSFPSWLIFSVSVSMGLTLCIRPQFVLIYFLLEGFYFFYNKKYFRSFFRIENIYVGLLGIAYLAVIYIFHREYIDVMLPLLLKYYVGSTSVHFADHFNFPYLCASCIPCVLMIFFRRVFTGFDAQFIDVLLLLFAGFLLSYFSQGTALPYHFMPLLFLALFFLLIMHYDADRLLQKIPTFDWLMLIASLPFLVVMLYYYQLRFHEFTAIDGLKLGAIFFLQIFLCRVISQKKSASLKLQQQNKSVLLGWFTLMSVLLICAIFYWGSTLYLFQYGFYYKKNVFIPMKNHIEKRIGSHSMMMFAIPNDKLFPAIFYTHARLGQSFDCLWFLFNLMQEKQGFQNFAMKYSPFVELYARDIYKYAPDFIVVDTTQLYYFDQKMQKDFLPYFLKVDLFKKAWQDYAYLETWRLPQTGGEAFEFKVYKHL